MEKTYIFHWLDGTTSKGKGFSVAHAFAKLGYGAGAMRALDYYEEEKLYTVDSSSSLEANAIER